MEDARRTILIVDDDDYVHGLLRAVIDSSRYLILDAIDGIEGLAMVKAHRPDLVVLDVQMPRLGGREVLAAIRNDLASAATLVVMLTGERTENDRRVGFDLGADAYIEKPFHAQTVARQIDQLINLQRR